MPNVQMTYVEHSSNVRNFILTHEVQFDRAVDRAATFGKTQIIRKTPWDTGTAAKAWEKRKVIPMIWTIEGVTGAGAKYVDFLDRGTGIYGPYNTPIVPVNAKALRFEINGTTIYAKSVKGQHGHYMINRSQPEIEERLEQEVDKVLERLQNE